MKAEQENIDRAKELAERFDVPHCVVLAPFPGRQWVVGLDLAVRRGHTILSTVYPGGSVIEFKKEGAAA